MSRTNKRAVAAQKTWGWKRWIDASRQDDWIAKLEEAGCTTWTATSRPGSSRLLLAVYSADRVEVRALEKKFGGQIRVIAAKEWLPTKPTPPTRIGRKLLIVHENALEGQAPALTPNELCIPHGVAFGSGEHATTFMLLRALADEGDLSSTRVLDLGTGSGVLALAARRFGARKIAATDFDPDSVRTARQNEALNFSAPLIRWQQGDVLKLHGKIKYDLVLANLFSGILCEAARQISASVAPAGRLWLSGILDSQKNEVAAAFRARGLKLRRAVRRGKWVMLQLEQPVRKRRAAK